MLELQDGSVALIDLRDVPLVAAVDWQLPRLDGEPYVVGYRFGEDRCPDLVYLHRLIAGADPDDIVAHRNGDTLDNRRENLIVMRRDRPELAPDVEPDARQQRPRRVPVLLHAAGHRRYAMAGASRVGPPDD